VAVERDPTHQDECPQIFISLERKVAGQKQYRGLEQRLAKEADALFEMIADGKAMREIAEHFGTSRSQLYRWLGDTDERAELLARARKQAAASHVDDALAGLDAALTPAEAQVAKERALMRRWLAERWDRGTFGTQPDAPAMSIGELHLHLLKSLLPQPVHGTEQSGLLASRTDSVPAR
jgi:hypothetical protein